MAFKNIILLIALLALSMSTQASFTDLVLLEDDTTTGEELSPQERAKLVFK